MMHTDREWLVLAIGVAIPYVAVALGALFVAELYQRGRVKARAEAEEPAETPVIRVVTYCPECAKEARAYQHELVIPPMGIQALCDAHSRVPAYVPESRQSAQNAQPLIRRIPVQFAEPTQAAWQAEQQADAEGQRLLEDAGQRDGDRWIPMWAYVDPIDPIWN